LGLLTEAALNHICFKSGFDEAHLPAAPKTFDGDDFIAFYILHRNAAGRIGITVNQYDTGTAFGYAAAVVVSGKLPKKAC
jgi:hypothetical protein